MALEIIGAGLGRTGTLSLKMALEELGFGPCYHMSEVHADARRARAWIEGYDGKPVEWETVFEGYRSTVDWPACHFWRELAAHYPEAKVLLSKRDSAAWYKSVRNTILKAIRRIPADLEEKQPFNPGVLGQRVLLGDFFDGRIDDEAHARAVFDAHNQAVIDAIPAERLLVYEPGQGWEPLCRFFDVTVPDSDYPHANSTEEFAKIFGDFGQRDVAQERS